MRTDVVIEQLDHMWLFYFTREGFGEKYCELKFGITNTTYFLYKAELKKYGYRFVYEQDLQPWNLTMMHGQNLTAGKRKFSEMEEKR